MPAQPSEEFDYVVVGSGAAGAIVASRLSEDPAVTVCLLEAGGRNTSPWLHIPAGFIKVVRNPAWTWQFSAEPGAWTAQRAIALPQGRTLGGTTSINGMIYNRGQADDFLAWSSLGVRGWSYEDVLPYFKRSERWLGADDSAFHGREGSIAVSRSPWRSDLCDAFIEAAGEEGIPRNDDYNGATQAGAGYFQRTIDGRWRSAVATTYLKRARGRPNLSILTRAHAQSLLFGLADQPRRATGVAYLRGGRPLQVRARREVIVSCGALNTPGLLELSGIGDPARLAAAGIAARHALPGVGENLADHYGVRVVARVKNARTINEMARGAGLLREIGRWLLDRPNVLAVSPSIVHWFAMSAHADGRPDLQGVFTPASYKDGAIGVLDDFPGMTAGVWPHRPRSRGSVHVESPDPMQAPRIRPNYLSDELDRRVLLDGIRKARAVLRAPAMRRYFVEETMPGEAGGSDEALLDFAARYGASAQHLVGTARVGAPADAAAVVDERLRLIGLEGVRIADASVIPGTPSANTCAAAMMVGERAADMIREDGRR
ncbi:choline dehydrogenase [Bordetella genomosp. 10]|uniref:Choline dehydrogenase n=1 Tax=Bordetella genomosp. 10 TaxID=1416804 RepID=A0A261S365_9BORD|nr:GMC family oxidoreductase N-terminal domain-containing protein [Bordetella genomosp. 10]OZI31615.1 choline dehydrogenase [Bordetella genomosp. 10]